MQVDHSGLINVLTAGWLWGTIAGSGIAFISQRLHFKHSLGEQRRVASMLIASQMRLWLIETANAFNEHPIFNQPDLEGDPNADVFPAPSDIPEFHFENSLTSISVLKSDEAQTLYDLIEQKFNAEREASVTAWLEDNEAAAEMFEVRVAQLFLDCHSIYAKLAKRVGWKEVVVGNETLADMQKRVAKLEEIRSRQSGVSLEDIPVDS